MADTKISALSAASAAAEANELAINEAGTSKKVTALQLKNLNRHFIRADVDRTLTSNTSAQAIFNAPTNGRLTLTTGVYTFNGVIIVTGMSATSGNALINILGGGTATVGSWMWRIGGVDNTTPATITADLSSYFQVSSSAASAVTAATGTAMRLDMNGSFECTSAGTMIPSITMVTASASVIQDGSYLNFERLGASGMTSVGAWD